MGPLVALVALCVPPATMALVLRSPRLLLRGIGWGVTAALIVLAVCGMVAVNAANSVHWLGLSLPLWGSFSIYGLTAIAVLGSMPQLIFGQTLAKRGPWTEEDVVTVCRFVQKRQTNWRLTLGPSHKGDNWLQAHLEWRRRTKSLVVPLKGRLTPVMVVNAVVRELQIPLPDTSHGGYLQLPCRPAK